jgi:hypothetical protein
MTIAQAFQSGRATAWTRERLDNLATPELLNLQANAVRLEEAHLAQLCSELLRRRPKSAGGRAPRELRRLVSLGRAFAARRVWLGDGSRSWSGIRKADGGVVLALWQRSIGRLRGGGCECLLWAPNEAGGRPWSDTAAGRERLEHCKAAVARGAAEGLLVHGEALADRLPEDRARTVLGIEAGRVLAMRVERRGQEYWAAWGDKGSASIPGSPGLDRA